ncbi:hypothetical protein L585_00395 [Pantoea ananatis BRT175]|nr:hypothetical protein L585_00395 [Pantoea ananatis BRT175]
MANAGDKCVVCRQRRRKKERLNEPILIINRATRSAVFSLSR